jgi:hypothetical protein
MTKLEELELKYSWKELASIPGDGNFRHQLFAPILNDLYENKIVYYERFMCVAILENIKITPELFEATAIPHVTIEREGKSYYRTKPWTFGCRWDCMSAHKGHFSTYGGMWLFWTDKDLVKTVEELACKKEFEKAQELTLYKE